MRSVWWLTRLYLILLFLPSLITSPHYFLQAYWLPLLFPKYSGQRLSEGFCTCSCFCFQYSSYKQCYISPTLGFCPVLNLEIFLSSYSFLHFSPQHLFNIWFIILLCLFILFTVFLHPLQNKHQWKDFFFVSSFLWAPSYIPGTQSALSNYISINEWITFTDNQRWIKTPELHKKQTVTYFSYNIFMIPKDKQEHTKIPLEN